MNHPIQIFFFCANVRNCFILKLVYIFAKKKKSIYIRWCCAETPSLFKSVVVCNYLSCLRNNSSAGCHRKSQSILLLKKVKKICKVFRYHLFRKNIKIKSQSENYDISVTFRHHCQQLYSHLFFCIWFCCARNFCWTP